MACRIGTLELDSPFVLAPMAGYTHLPFRLLCRRHGAGMVSTELVSADGLARGVPSVQDDARTDPAERPVAAHLYGHRPEAFAEAAAIAAATCGFDAIDINAGCPVRKIVARGAGAGLLRDPARLAAIVRAVRAAVALPVTVKTRIGPAEGKVTIWETLAAVEDAGAAGIAIHARFTARRHSGPSDWDLIGEVKARARIAVIGNGGVRTASDAVARLRASGADAVMIGRAALGNPWIFAQARALLAGGAPAEPTPSERRTVLMEHLRGLIALDERQRRRRRTGWDPETAAVRHFRGHLIHYTAGGAGALDLRRGLNDLWTVADVEAALDRLDRARDVGPAAEGATRAAGC